MIELGSPFEELEFAMRRIKTAKFISFALAFVCLAGCDKAGFSEKPASRRSQLAEQLVGSWVHVGSPGQVRDVPVKGGRFKFRTGTHWNLTNVDPENGLVRDVFGGSYYIHGDEYVETQMFADPTWVQDNGKSFKFKVKIEGDTMTQFGVDNSFNEVWKRVK
jgi:hypothetical protein